MAGTRKDSRGRRGRTRRRRMAHTAGRQEAPWAAEEVGTGRQLSAFGIEGKTEAGWGRTARVGRKAEAGMMVVEVGRWAVGVGRRELEGLASCL